MSTSMPDDVRDVLSRSTITATSVTLPPGQLDRKLYEAVNKALTALGGKWNRRQRAHLFTRDPRAALETAVDDAKMPVHQDKVMSFWRTPAKLAERLWMAVNDVVPAQGRVLEPSAGDGAIAERIQYFRRDVDLWCVEPDEYRARALRCAAFQHVFEQTFEDFAADAERRGEEFDAVVMNPPFTTADDRLAYVDHVTLAWSLLKPGGRLAAIVPASFATRQDRRVRLMREHVVEFGGWWEELEDGAFTESGTGVRTLLLVVPAPAAVDAPTPMSSTNIMISDLTTSTEAVESSPSSDTHPVAPHPEETPMSTPTDAPATEQPAATVIPDDVVLHPRYEIGTRHTVDVADLVIGANVRTDIEFDKGFLNSLRMFGILQAIHVYQPGDDERAPLVVEDGQMRTLGALQVDLQQGPVEIIADPNSADRIYQQYTQNKHRHAMSLADEARAVKQLALYGERASEVAKKLGHTAKDGKRLRTIADSSAALDAVGTHGLDLLQADAVAEFDGDPTAVKHLLAAAKQGPGSFTHVLQRLRDDRDERAAIAELRASAEAQGLAVVDQAGHGCTEQRLSALGYDPDDATAIQRHRETCEGHAVLISHKWVGGGKREFVLVPVCVDPAANGHELPEDMKRDQPKKKVADMDPAEAEATRAEKRRVIENNKAWQSAVTVRRAWIRELIARKTVPAGAEVFIAREMLNGSHWLREAVTTHPSLLAEMLGVEPVAGRYGIATVRAEDVIAKAAATSPKKATLLTIAMIFCAWETTAGADDQGKSSWRTGGDSARRILGQMAAWGYPLSDVEKLAVAPPTGDADIIDAGAVSIPREFLDMVAPVDDQRESGPTGAVVIDGTVVAVTEHHDLAGELVDA